MNNSTQALEAIGAFLEALDAADFSMGADAHVALLQMRSLYYEENMRRRRGRPPRFSCRICGHSKTAGIHMDRDDLQSTRPDRLHRFQPR